MTFNAVALPSCRYPLLMTCIRSCSYWCLATDCDWSTRSGWGTLRTSALRSRSRNAVVCVTGAGGSIGSELCRQSLLNLHLNWFSLSAVNLPYAIEQELRLSLPDGVLLRAVLVAHPIFSFWAFICSWRRGIVFHAAAYKHVPLVELILAGLANVGSTRSFVALQLQQASVKLFWSLPIRLCVQPTWWEHPNVSLKWWFRPML